MIKSILLIITGGIAAYKSLELIRLFKKKGAQVKVISGKDAGKQGKVLQAFPKKGTVLVEGVNVTKKHQKPQGQTMQGGVIDKSMPLNVSNVALVVKKKAGRVSYKFDKNGKKYRVLAQTGDEA